MPEQKLLDFTGGLWFPEETAPTTEQPGFAIPANALLRAENVEYLPSGGVKVRRGRRLDATLGGAVKSMFRHYPRTGITVQGPTAGFSAATTDLGGPTFYPDFQGSDVTNDPWVTPANALIEDATLFASVALGPQRSSEWLQIFLKFIIPGTAVIRGLEVEVKRRTSTLAPSIDFDVRLFTSAVQFSDNRKLSPHWPVTFPFDPGPRPFVFARYGGPADLWGVTLTPALLNSGVDVSFLISAQALNVSSTAEVDYVQATVYYEDAAPARVFVVAHESGATLIYNAVSGGVGTPISGGTVPAPLARTRYIRWPEKNATFLFDGRNAVRRFNGTTIDVVQTGGQFGIAPRKGPYAALWQDRLFATDPMEADFSVYASELSNETEWNPQLQIALNDPHGGQITGLVAAGDRLVILKESSLWYLTGDIEFGTQLVRYSEQGCVAPDSVQLTPHGVVYLGRDGLYLTDGNSAEPLELSRPVRPLFVSRSTETLFASAVGVYFPRKDQYRLNLTGAAASGYVLQRVIVPKQNEDRPGSFWCWGLMNPMPQNAAAIWEGQGDLGELYTGATDGKVFEEDDGTTDVAAAIFFEIMTSQRLLDPDRRRGRVVQLKPLVRSARKWNMALRYDQILTDDVFIVDVGSIMANPEYQEPRQYVTNKTKFGRFVSIRIVDTEAVGGVQELHALNVDYQLRSLRRWPA